MDYLFVGISSRIRVSCALAYFALHGHSDLWATKRQSNTKVKEP